MNTLIAYSSKYGGTRSCAERIAASLKGPADLLDLDTKTDVDLTAYEQVVIGTSIYMGKPRKAAMPFCKKNLDALLTKRIGLFLCCIQDLEKPVADQFRLSFPEALREKAAAAEQLGGIVDFSKLRRMDRVIMNMIAGDLKKKTNSDVVSTVSDDRINAFCALLEKG